MKETYSVEELKKMLSEKQAEEALKEEEAIKKKERLDQEQLEKELKERAEEEIVKEKRPTREKKSFLGIMVRVVFFSTFIFTGIMIAFIWIKGWEMLATTLVERWFTIMVGELIIAGLIQVAKEFTKDKENVND